MTLNQFEAKMHELTRSERRITNQILEMINLAMDRKFYLERGYPSLYEWLIGVFGYSESAAYRRIQAARLLREVPQAGEKLESGEVSLTSLAKAQSAIKACEKRTGLKISAVRKTAIVEKLEKKSSGDVELTLITELPEIASKLEADRKARLAIDLPTDVLEEINRAREILAHALPNATPAEIIAYITKFFLDRKDPLRKPNTAAVSQVGNSQPSASVRRLVLQRANGACEWKDPVTGKVCGSKYLVEIDHVQMRAMNGGHGPENLRCLCAAHNKYMSERNLGTEKANRWRRSE